MILVFSMSSDCFFSANLIIFVVFNQSYLFFIRFNQSKLFFQCCVISGESGSGKTVTANFLIQQFATIGKATDTGVNLKLVKKILQVNDNCVVYWCIIYYNKSTNL